MRIIEGGQLTTVQDLGRFGYQKIGVTPNGAMDAFSLRIANILVDNPEDAAGLEITMQGPFVEFSADALIAVTGADLTPMISDLGLPLSRAVAVRDGSVLTFGRAKSGCRAYLAIAGGVDVPLVMRSRSTHLRAGIGGHEGRALRMGDELPIGTVSTRARNSILHALSGGGPLPFALTDRRVEEGDRQRAPDSRAIRCVRGPHFDVLDDADKDNFLGAPFAISTEADRMGYRLVGPRLSPGGAHDLVSSAVTMGCVQLPPGGEPIVLMADRQTTGGYPVIAQVITADLRFVAQMKPGDELRFTDVAITDAQEALRDLDQSLTDIRTEIDAAVSG